MFLSEFSGRFSDSFSSRFPSKFFASFLNKFDFESSSSKPKRSVAIEERCFDSLREFRLVCNKIEMC